MKTHFRLLMIAGLLLWAACEGGIDPEVQVRVHNTSDYRIGKVVINPYDEEIALGDLRAGQASDYVSVNLAYRYAWVSIEYEGQTYQQIPIDYVGETPLENGQHTYELTFDPPTETVTLFVTE